ncbi:MAG TPA: GIY-YIG nuclease family protein [Candidatus Paceibacterota bacterium]
MFIYALINEDNRIYVRMTNSLARRVKEHNSGYVFSTKGYLPWKLLYVEEVKTRQEARNREKYLKSGIGKEFLKSIKPM